MDKPALLEFALGRLRRQIQELDDADLDSATNCEPWTVRELASHALNNQLLWGGVVTGEELVSVEETMGAVPHPGDLSLFAIEVERRALAMWGGDGVLDAHHATPFGELPGAVVIDFPTVDALCHTWDLASSIGQPLEFPSEKLPVITALVEATCTDAVRGLGLISDPSDVPSDATATEQLMALAGRSIRR